MSNILQPSDDRCIAELCNNNIYISHYARRSEFYSLWWSSAVQELRILYRWLGREPVHYTQDTRLVVVVEMRGCPRLVTLSQMNMLLAVYSARSVPIICNIIHTSRSSHDSNLNKISLAHVPRSSEVLIICFFTEFFFSILFFVPFDKVIMKQWRFAIGPGIEF